MMDQVKCIRPIQELTSNFLQEINRPNLHLCTLDLWDPLQGRTYA